MDYLSKENIHELLALSPLQESIYSDLEVSQAKQGMVQRTYNIKGRIQLDVFTQACTTWVGRHPQLRTIVRKVKNRNIQIVLKTYKSPLDLQDLCDVPASEQQTRVEAAIASCREPFNLGEDPMVRISLLRLAEQESVLIWTHHTILLDDTSQQLLLQDLLLTYEALVAGQTAPQLSHQSNRHYLDWVAKQDTIKTKRLWHKEIDSELIPSLLPFHKKVQEGVAKGIVKQASRALPVTVSQLLEQLAVRFQITVDELLRAAWAVLLSAYRGEEEVVFDYVSHGRPASLHQASEMVGVFANQLPLPVHLDGDVEFQTLLTATRGLPDANAHAYLPLRDIWKSEQRVHLDGFRTVLRVSTQPNVANTLDVQVLESYRDTDYLDLEIITGATWYLQINYREHLFTADSIERLQTHVLHLLTSIAEQGGGRLSQWNLLSPEEHHQLTVEFNRKAPGRPLDRLFHQVIEEQAVARPDAIAAMFRKSGMVETCSITYRELNESANQLAHWMRETGFGRDDLAVIFAQRDLNMLITIVAIAKAGGAYVPMDPDHPDNRLVKILEQCQPKIVYTQNQYWERMEQLTKELAITPLLIRLDQEPLAGAFDPASLAQYPVTNPPFLNEPNDLAYVFFTSGSTGTPKGVMVEHLGVINHLWSKVDLLQVNEASVVVQNASHCFDISVWQFLSALLMGGKTVVYDNKIAADPEQLLAAVEQDQVTILEVVPTMLEMMLQSMDAVSVTLPTLQYLLSTGEALSVSVANKWINEFPHIPVVNAYGPTECSDDTLHEVMREAVSEELPYVPVGVPIPNFNVYIFDRWGHPVPIGCAGEVFFTGVGIGRGYLNDAERTEKAFLKNPFDDGMGEKMYRTGDLGSFLPDGHVLYHGRIDHQVKIRGNRIELGEIESALLHHPEIRQCVVVARTDSQNRDEIVAYVVGKQPVEEAALKQYLSTVVPKYMIPDRILLMDEFPVNRNGKVDRKLLPEPVTAKSHATVAEPTNDTEKELLLLWSEIIGVSGFGIDDNFFELGGNSLKTIQLRSRLKKQFQANMPLSVLFDYQTVRGQAQYLQQAQTDEATIGAGCLVLLQKGTVDLPPLFFVHPIEGDVVCYTPLVRELGSEQTVYGLQAVGYETDETPLADVQAMAVRYLDEIKSVWPQGPYRLAGWSFGGVIAYEITHLLELAGETVEFLGMIDSSLYLDEKVRPGQEHAQLVRLATQELEMSQEEFAGLTFAQGLTKVLAKVKERRLFGISNRIAIALHVPSQVATDLKLFQAVESNHDITWTQQLQGVVTVEEVPGNHFSMMEPPHVQQLATVLKKHLQTLAIH